VAIDVEPGPPSPDSSLPRAAPRYSPAAAPRDAPLTGVRLRRHERVPRVEHAARPRGPLLDVTVYAADCRVVGRLELLADRLTDFLNAREEVVLRDVWVESLGEGLAAELRELSVAREEIFAVTAGGPRGLVSRRRRVRPHPITMTLGPYAVRGEVHALPGADPFARFRERGGMVPLTGATVSYETPAGPQRDHSDTLLVRADAITWMGLTTSEGVRFPELELAIEGVGLAKDFTGEIRERNGRPGLADD